LNITYRLGSCYYYSNFISLDITAEILYYIKLNTENELDGILGKEAWKGMLTGKN
jgi:hypothetical protein